MPEQEPTPWELLRALQAINKAIGDVTTRLERHVSAELFVAYQREIDRRFDDIRSYNVSRRTEHDADIKELKDRRQRDEDARRQLRLLAVTAIVTAVLSFFSMLAVQILGAH